MSKDQYSQTGRVWDPLVRLFHWSLVAACLIAYFTQEQNYRLHLISGYAILALILFRLIWGFTGSKYARFSDFLCSPGAVARYLSQLFRGRAPRHLGHNPAGGAMILVMLATLFLLTLSGVALDAAENRAGPLSGTRLFLYTDMVAEVHSWLTDIMCLLVFLHLAGVLISSVLHRENLVRAMITGRKRMPD